MLPRSEMPRLRLDWADRHFDKLKAVIDDFGKREAGKYSIECDLETREHVYRAVIDDAPPADIAFLVSDVIHNLRAALDNLLWAIIERPGATPPNDLQFPMCVGEDEFGGKDSRWPKRLRRVPDAVFYALDMLQPYQPRYSVGTGKFLDPAPNESPLAFLNVLSNRDKHRAPHIAAFALYSRLILIRQPDEGAAELVRFNTNPLNDGDEIMRLRVTPTDATTDIQPSLAFNIGFDARSGMTGGTPVMETLIDIRQFIREVAFPALLPFLQDQRRQD